MSDTATVPVSLPDSDSAALAFVQSLKADAVELPTSWPGDGSAGADDKKLVKGKLFRLKPIGPPIEFLAHVKAEFGPVLGSDKVHVYDYVVGRGRFLAPDGNQQMFYPKDHAEAGSDRYVWFVAEKSGETWAPVRLASSGDVSTVRFGYLKDREPGETARA